MKVLDSKEEQLKTKIRQKNLLRSALEGDRTSFWLSVVSLIIEIVPINLILWLITAPEISFAPWKVPAGIGFALILVELLLVSGLSSIGVIIKLHNYDQIIINFGFTAISIGFYLTGFWWPHHNFFYRVLVVIPLIFLFLPIGAILAAFLKHLILKRQDAKANKK